MNACMTVWASMSGALATLDAPITRCKAAANHPIIKACLVLCTALLIDVQCVMCDV